MDKMEDLEGKSVLLALLITLIYPVLAILYYLATGQIEGVIANEYTALFSAMTLIVVAVVAIACVGTAVISAQPRYIW